MKKIKIYFNVWGIWFAINFLIAPFPIVVLKFIPGSDPQILFSSYLSYIFSVSVVSAGVLYFHFKKERVISFKDLIFWIDLFIILLIGFTYLFYNWPNNSLAKFIDNKLKYIFLSSAIGIIVVSVLLHGSYLNNKAEEQLNLLESELRLKGAEKVKENMRDVRQQLEKEELE